MTSGHVIVVDDDEAVLDSLLELFSAAGLVARGFTSPIDMLDRIADLAPGVVVTDVRMPGMTGIELMRRLRELGCGDWPIVVISGHADVAMAMDAMRGGAVDFLEKPFEPDMLLAAVVLGHQRLAAFADPDTRAIRDRYIGLTARECEVISQLVAGASSKSAAIALGISPRTVDVFRAKILRKMAVDNVAALATMVARLKVG